MPNNPFYNRLSELNLFLPLVGSTMLELGNKKNEEMTYKEYFTNLGFNHTSVDLNGQDGALVLDLRVPLNLGTFDIVSNIGTSEHVTDQNGVWNNIVDAVALNGVMISITPFPGDWKQHGRYYPTIQFYEQLAQLNGFLIERLFTFEDEYGPSSKVIACRAQKIYDTQFKMPDLHLIYDNGA